MSLSRCWIGTEAGRRPFWVTCWGLARRWPGGDCAGGADPLLREPTLFHLGLLLYQSLFVASFGFLFWFHLLMTYPASSVASFSFLTPILGVLLGWGLLGEDVGWEILAAMVLVAVGITLINRPAKGRPR